MKPPKPLGLFCRSIAVSSLLLFTLTGCDDGTDGVQGSPGIPGESISTTASELNFSVNSAEIGSPPIVKFNITNENGVPFKGIGDTDLRFNIAKLITGVDGNPSRWQNYIVGARNGSNSGSQERNRGRDSDIWGELINHGDGSYTYTFETDVTAAACPAPCTDADGNALDVSYNPALTHRISIQQGNSALPVVNAIYDFVPNGSPITSQREITKTENCNVCHDKITAHGSRFEIKLCVTCHNPGTWNATGNTTADLPVMIHKIHRGADLPSVLAGGTYAVGSHDFSDVKFPQDIRNCTKCHDGADAETPTG